MLVEPAGVRKTARGTEKSSVARKLLKKKTNDSRHTTVMRQEIKYIIESQNIDSNCLNAMIYYYKQLLNTEGRIMFQNGAQRSLKSYLYYIDYSILTLQ